MKKLIIGTAATILCAFLPLTAFAQQAKPDNSGQTDPWLQGMTGIQAIVRYASESPEKQSDADKYVANKLLIEWRLSSVYNSYKPFRKVLADKYTAAKALSEDDHAQFNGILFRASKLIDEYYKDKMPDYLYDWLETESKGGAK